MLVLSRKANEKIFVAVPGRENPIVVQIIRVRDDGVVRVGIEADRDIVIAREELLPNDPTTTV